ncbi:mitotic checkpoint protein BUB3 [Myriangium duriaei CBS 260.36]|uniref:Mitotic checkpoint protein BUB3 n=1 Tax=Myriangium duriaei CBS 260.36 TaxID=1168546 RepID=A0A9P4MNV1_9PEZI|nr:mitotic checkpoint protein BUB3 [Myriangium duriaei CBS 260.36]
MSAPQYELSEPPTDVISAVKFAPHSDTRLLVSSWDRHIYLYEVASPLNATEGHLLLRVEHRAPVLDICFGEDDDTAYSAGLDQDVNQINLETGKKTVLSTHDAGVRNVVYSREHQLLISSSWDKTLHIHPISSESPTQQFATIALPDKPHCLAASATNLVVAVANKEILVYSLSDLREAALQPNPPDPLPIYPWQHREPALKYMTRALACHPNDTGFAISSIEGRIGVEFFDPSPEAQAGKYAFRCHRVTTDDEDIVYPVNALAFNPVRTTVFASGGGDGAITFWDGASKRRIRHYAGFASSVAALAWSQDGRTMAVGTSPGFEDGKEEIDTSLIRVYVKSIPEGEVKVKAKAK